jgi:hypothetical protein
MAGGVPAGPIVGADGRFISVGISVVLFCLLVIGHDAGRRGPGMPFNQMAVTVKHALGFAASRRVKRFEDTDENIRALRAWVRCSFNIAHR